MSDFFSKKYAKLIPYVPGEQPQDKQYVKLNTNESPFPPSPIAQRMAREAAGDCELYSDPECKALRQVAAEKYGLNDNQFIFTNGSDDILNFAFMAFSDNENPVVFPDITYGFYKVFADLHNIPYSEIPTNADFTINVDDYIGINKNIFIANPNAPTAIALSLADIEKIVSTNPNNVVVIDEAYVDFGAESAVCLIDKYDNLLVTQTFSKSRSMAGARLGMGIGNEKLINDLNTIRFSTNPYNINRMTMAMGIGALIDEDYFEDNCEIIKRNRAYLMNELNRLGFVFTESATNFVFAKHPNYSGEDIYLKLKEKGVLVRHFSIPKIADYNRITVGSLDEISVLVSKLEEIL